MNVTKISSAKIKNESNLNNRTFFAVNNKKHKKIPRCKSAYITRNSLPLKKSTSSFSGINQTSNKNIGIGYNVENNIKQRRQNNYTKEVGFPLFSSKNSTAYTFNIRCENKSNDFKKIDFSVHSSYSKSKKISYDNYFLGRSKSNNKGRLNNSLSIKNINFEKKNNKNKIFNIKTLNEIHIQKILDKAKKLKSKNFVNKKNKEEEIIKKVNVYDNIPFLFLYAKKKEIENEKIAEMTYNKNSNIYFHKTDLKKEENRKNILKFPVKYCFLNGILNNILHSVEFIDINKREESQQSVKIKNDNEINNILNDFKTFGYELDPNLIKIKNEEIKQQKVKEQLDNIKNQTNEIKFHYNKINKIYNIKRMKEERKNMNKEKKFYKELYKKYKKSNKTNKNKYYNYSDSKYNYSFYKYNKNEEFGEEVKLKKDRNYIRNIFIKPRSKSVANNIKEEKYKDSNDNIEYFSSKKLTINNQEHENNEGSENNNDENDDSSEKIKNKITNKRNYSKKLISSIKHIKSYIHDYINDNKNKNKNENNFQIINYFGPSDIINYKSSGKHTKKHFVKRTKSSKKIKINYYTNKIKNKQDNETNQKVNESSTNKKSRNRKKKEDYYEYEYIYLGSHYSSSEKNSASNIITSISNQKKDSIKNKIISKKTELTNNEKDNDEKQKEIEKNKEKKKEKNKNNKTEEENNDSSDISISNKNENITNVKTNKQKTIQRSIPNYFLFKKSKKLTSITNFHKNFSTPKKKSIQNQAILRIIKTCKKNAKYLKPEKCMIKIKKFNKKILLIQKEVMFQINELELQKLENNTQDINQSVFDFNRSRGLSRCNSNKKNNILKSNEKENSAQNIKGKNEKQKKKEENSRYDRRRAVMPLDKDLIEYAIKDLEKKNINELIHKKYNEIENKKIADLEDVKNSKFSFDVDPNNIKDVELQKEILLYKLEENIKTNIKQGKYDYNDLGDFQKFEYNLKSGMIDTKNKWQAKKYIVSLVRRFNEFQEQLDLKEVQKQDEERINKFIKNLNNFREKIPMAKYHMGRKCHSSDYQSTIMILSELLKLYL